MLLSPRYSWARLQIPYAPPDEYDLFIVAERVRGRETLEIGNLADGGQFLVSLDGAYWTGGLSGLEMLDGYRADWLRNETARPGHVFTNGVPRAITCEVRKMGVRVLIDGQETIDWRGDPTRLAISPNWAVPSDKALLIGAYNSIFRITRLSLHPISGEGRVLLETATE